MLCRHTQDNSPWLALGKLFLWVPCLCLLTLTAGCMVGPDFHPPQTPVPSTWNGSSGQPAPTAAQADLVHWWTTFNDPVLTSLVNRAVQSNLDLRQAASRLRQARAERGVAFAPLLPTADLLSAFNRSRASGGTSGGGSSASRGRGGTTGTTPIVASNLYQMNFDAAWEIDVFGGVRRGLESADANVLAAIEDERSVLVSLVAEVALNYIELRGFQQQIAIAQENITAQKKTASITRQRQEAGFVSALDVANADAQVATTQSGIPVLETAAKQTIYTLSVLLGQDPAALVKELTPPAAIPVAAPEIPLGLPANLLLRRPDIRRAEAQVHAATAQIGVATADLFPKFSLTGSAGYQSNLTQNLTKWNSRFWSFGPSADWQIFSGGRILSNIEIQRALTEQALLTYQQTILTALQDVENALVASNNELEHRKYLTEAVAYNRKAVDLSMQLYTEGQVEFLDLLVTQRSLYNAEDALVQSNRDVSTDLVSLYKALGGGWDDQPSAAAAPAPKKTEAAPAPAGKN